MKLNKYDKAKNDIMWDNLEIDLIGLKKNYLTIIGSGFYDGRTVLKCLCDCGNEKVILVKAFTGIRPTKSCGCVSGQFRRKHGHSKGSNLTYSSWSAMKERCYNPNSAGYCKYGGAGITVATEWLDFSNFLRDMGERTSKEMTIDRIDGSGNYCKENCRWATKKKQSQNRRVNIFVEHEGQKMCLMELCEKLNLPYTMMNKRLNDGWDLDRAINTPDLSVFHIDFEGQVRSLTQIARDHGLNYNTVFFRYSKGWPMKRVVTKFKRNAPLMVEFEGKSVNLKELAKTYKIPFYTLRYRILNAGLTAKQAVEADYIPNKKNNNLKGN